ncbi:MAG: PcfJ domain-containing protein [Fimbriimonas sp.]
MRKLCHEWHRTVYAGHLREYRSWAPSLPLWEVRLPGRAVRAVELTTNRALADEGKKQRHCVYTYTAQCLEGRSRIVSLRWFAVASAAEDPTLEIHRITVEVSPGARAVVQVRGSGNRRPTDEEIVILRRWAGDHGLVIQDFAY